MLTKITTDNVWVLEQLHRIGYTSAVIAGGAVRDAYFHKIIHDIDIFYQINPSNPEDLHNRTKVVKLLELDTVDTTPADEAGMVFTFFDYADDFIVLFDGKRRTKKSYYSSPHIKSVVEVGKDESIYQLIGLSCDPLTYINQYFDVDLCRCYCDGQRMRYTQAFLNDAGQQTITISGDLTVGEYRYSLKNHIPRLRRYYPNFRVVDLLQNTVLPTC